jgi:hypothetical protein
MVRAVVDRSTLRRKKRKEEEKKVSLSWDCTRGREWARWEGERKKRRRKARLGSRGYEKIK